MSDRCLDIALDYEIPGAGSPVLIASAYSDEGDNPLMPGYIAPDVAEANARLIAAAPEMLDALRAAERDLATVEREISGLAPEGKSPALKVIRALLAKLEGRS